MKDSPHYHGHRGRLRQRFLDSRGEALQGYELLEMLLFYSIPRKDTKPLAKALLKRFGSVAGVLDATYEELCQVDGIGPATAVHIKLIKRLIEEYKRSSIQSGHRLSSPEAVIEYLKVKMAGLKDEQFRVLYLDNQNRLIKESIIQEGTPTEAVVYPRRVIEEALRVKATGMILVHNHPSGSLEPSQSDRLLTEKLKLLAEALGLRLVDHFIVTPQGYTSFHHKGLL
ncbi:MAG: DNA repair protein RadC [Nitrospirae bacterium]|nr:MAG: DNA repair protein RadC [Nitrospirota bacterium]